MHKMPKLTKMFQIVHLQSKPNVPKCIHLVLVSSNFNSKNLFLVKKPAFVLGVKSKISPFLNKFV